MTHRQINKAGRWKVTLYPIIRTEYDLYSSVCCRPYRQQLQCSRRQKTDKIDRHAGGDAYGLHVCLFYLLLLICVALRCLLKVWSSFAVF